MIFGICWYKGTILDKDCYLREPIRFGKLGVTLYQDYDADGDIIEKYNIIGSNIPLLNKYGYKYIFANSDKNKINNLIKLLCKLKNEEII